MADMADAGREARVGQGGEGWGCGKGQLTRIFLFAISLAACAVGKAQMSGWAVVVVLATHGGVQGTLSWKVEPPSIVPLLSSRSPTRYLETPGYRVVYLGCSSRPPPTRVTRTMSEVDSHRVVESSGRVVVKNRGGRICRSLPIGVGSGEQA